MRVRKLYGGAMRQVGYLAAAGIYALDHHVNRLSEDHRRAKQLGKALEASAYVKTVEPIETNILIFTLIDEIRDEAFIEAMEAKNILMISMGAGKLRMVTHLDFTEEMLQKVITEIEALKFI